VLGDAVHCCEQSVHAGDHCDLWPSLARLDRDRPDLTAKVRAGELSVNKAAIGRVDANGTSSARILRKVERERECDYDDRGEADEHDDN
jgi:hypothetical protein